MSIFGDDPEETYGYDNGNMSEYQLLLQQEQQDRLLKQQIRKHGDAEVQAAPASATIGIRDRERTVCKVVGHEDARRVG